MRRKLHWVEMDQELHVLRVPLHILPIYRDVGECLLSLINTSEFEVFYLAWFSHL